MGGVVERGGEVMGREKGDDGTLRCQNLTEILELLHPTAVFFSMHTRTYSPIGMM